MRLQEPAFLVLTALADEPRHGYAVLAEIEKITGTSKAMRVGTLYTALDRLAREGIVEIASEEVVAGRNRRTYRLTDAGREVLHAEAEKMARLSRQARTRLGGIAARGLA